LSVNIPDHALRDDTRNDIAADRNTETKAAFKTTEFVVLVVAVVGVLLASALVGDSDGRGDVFLADKAWLYVTLLAVGYMISRGLAKSGVRARRDA
jgi:di/tricarboxylate transporter